MADDPYERFNVPRPEHIGEAHAESIDLELQRFARAMDANDDGQAIGCLKCLVEAIAKVVLDINGTPAAGADSFDPTVKRAHDLLAGQPGHELALASHFGNLATQARKMAVSMSAIRNDYGGGHGRARQPELTGEMLDLAIDGSLLWTRWALRRLGYFARGRPETLIRDLVGDPGGQIVFYSGDLSARLQSADLPKIEHRYSRSIGIAVGQRAARDTFNVRIEGVDPLLETDDLERWPSSYRLGVANGLLFGPDELPTIRAATVRWALGACIPVTDEADEISDLIRRAMATQPPGPLPGQAEQNQDLRWFLEQNTPSRPLGEQQAWTDLSRYLRGEVATL